MFWNKSQINVEAMKNIRTTSKLSLKFSCYAICKGDVEKAEQLYDYFAKDMQLPDVDPISPTTFQQVKDTAGTLFGWFKENRDDVVQAFNFVQSLRKGQPIITTPSAPIESIPPLPNE